MASRQRPRDGRRALCGPFPHDLAPNLTEVFPLLGLSAQGTGTTGPLGSGAAPSTIGTLNSSLAGGSFHGEPSHADVPRPRPADRRSGGPAVAACQGTPAETADDVARHGLGDLARGPSVTFLRRGRSRQDRSDGQTLVEFALVFPMFFILFLGVIEFAFAFNAMLAVNFASRNAALAAAEAGTSSGADCVILRGIEEDVSAPANARAHHQARDLPGQVQRRRLRPAHEDRPGPADRPTSCTLPDGRPTSVPYTRTGNGYPEAEPLQHPRGLPGPRTPHHHRPHRRADLLRPPVRDAARDIRRDRGRDHLRPVQRHADGADPVIAPPTRLEARRASAA